MTLFDAAWDAWFHDLAAEVLKHEQERAATMAPVEEGRPTSAGGTPELFRIPRPVGNGAHHRARLAGGGGKR